MWHSGLMTRWGSDWMILEIFSNLSNSGILKDFWYCFEILEREAFLDGNSFPACRIPLPVGCLNSCGDFRAVLKAD